MLEVFRDLCLFGSSSRYDLTVENGILIKKIPTQGSSSPDSTHNRSCSGLCVLPSGVDMQVHLRTPGQSEKESPETGIKAALHGGYGAVLSMPNTKPTIDCPEVLEMANKSVEEMSKKYGITALFCSSVSQGLAGKDLVDLKAMARAGAAAFTDDGKGIEPDDFMKAAFRASAEMGIPVLQHAEWTGHKGVLADCALSRQLGLAPYERKEEWSFVERDLKLLREFPGARYHVLHVTTRESLDLIRSAKDDGLKVTAEVSPHHLFFCADDIDPKNTSFKMNPPLHQAEDREALRRALNEGLLDFIATDHAPHEASAKGSDFAKAAYGTVGLETSLKVILTGVSDGWLRADRVWDVFSRAPARFLGLDQEYGVIEEGKPFRAVFFNADAVAEFTEKDLHSRSKNSCFLGQRLRAKIVGHYTKAGFFTL